ncbi:MAG: hypothetical protein R3F48_14805 [Candidatus Zixiibacteriota bacterium]
MFFWCAILFVLGVAAFMDSMFNYGEIFRQINSVIFLLISVALLVRTSTKQRLAKTEHYLQRIEELEQKIANMTPPADRSLSSRDKSYV